VFTPYAPSMLTDRKRSDPKHPLLLGISRFVAVYDQRVRQLRDASFSP